MKLLYDGTVYQTGIKYHGGGEYSNAVFSELLKKLKNSEIEVFFDQAYNTDNVFFDICKKEDIKLYPISNPAELEKLIREGQFDKIYSALMDKRYFYGINIPEQVKVVFTLHGLRVLELRNEDMPIYSAYAKNIFAKVIRALRWIYRCNYHYKDAISHYSWQINGFKNKSIITVSRHSKYSLLSYFPELKESEIKIFYSPGKLISEREEIKEDYYQKYDVEDQGYGLIISASREEKNALRGMKAYDEVFSSRGADIPKNYKVIVLGANRAADFQKYLKNPERFIFRQYVETGELEWLYRHAQLFLYPTLNEGFGYPPLEAMKYGTLCACSAITSIPEICGDAVLYYNPLSIKEIENRILQSFNEDIRKEKAVRMVEQYHHIRQRQDEDLKKMSEYIIKC